MDGTNVETRWGLVPHREGRFMGGYQRIVRAIYLFLLMTALKSTNPVIS